MPALPNVGLSRGGSVRTPHPRTPVTPIITTTTKTPYWAGTEVSVQSPGAQSPAARVVSRKPVGRSASNSTTPTQPTSPPGHSIPRKPVPTSPSSGPNWKYNPLEGNPYSQDSAQQWVKKSGSGSIRRDTSPPHISVWEADSPRRRKDSHREAPLSPGVIAAAARTQAVKVLSRGIGSVRKAAQQAKRKISVSNEPKVSSPVPGSFHRGGSGHVLEAQIHVPALDLVGLEQAQADKHRFGQADHTLADARAAGPTAMAYYHLTGELPPQSPRVTRQPAPSTPVPAQNQTFAASVPPVTPVAPVAPLATKPKLPAPRKVVGQEGRETVFGDIIAAGYDSSWATEPKAQSQANASTQPRTQSNGKGKASMPRAPPVMPESFIPVPAAGNPFANSADLAPASLKVKKQSVHLDKSLPPSPAPGSLRRFTQKPPQSTTARPSHPTVNGIANNSLANTLASNGVRQVSYVPGVKCSDCGKMIDAVAVSDHRCGRRAAQAVDSESTPTGPSREEVYAANVQVNNVTIPSQEWSPATNWGKNCGEILHNWSEDDDSEDVIVDTFVRDGYTSWKGVMRTESEDENETIEGRVVGGMYGVRRSNEWDEARGWRNKSPARS